MKKSFFARAASLLCALTLFSTAALAAPSFSWYCVRKKDHVRPVCEPNLAFIERHGGHYLGNDEKVIYLTFDAGYENGNVERILDTLKAHNAHGAFFVLSNLIKTNTDLVLRMANEGHLVCNHTVRHKDMSAFSDADFEAELRALENIAKEYGVPLAPFYRPPEGRFSEQNLICAEKMGYDTVFWSFAYADWDNARQPRRESAMKLILDNTHNGEIALLHPTSKTNADILDALLTEWEAQGYRFGELWELKEGL